jgi:serine/threonine-protein kinase
VTPRHGQPFAKILDFGIAKLMGEISAAATEPGVAMGTPHFMAPEQCRGEALVDHRADIYAMGVILYRNWAGRLPFEGETFMSVVSQQITATPTPPSAYAQVPARLERLILACLEKDPARRPQSARALAVELDAALADAIPGETLPSVPLPQPLPPPTRLRRRWFWVVAALATAFAGLAALFLGTGHRHAEILTMPTTSSPLPVPLVEQAAPKEPLPPSAAARPDKGVPRFSAPPRHSSRPVEVKASPSSPLDTKGFLTDNPFR